MQPTNPYEPPATDPALQEPELPRILVDGTHLVVASGTELPRRCIRTNQPVGERNAVHQKLVWRGRTFQFTMSSETCDLTWYAMSSIAWKSRIRRISELLMGPAYIFPIFFLGEDRIWPEILLGFAFLMLSLVVLLRQPLRIVEYKKNRFWIKGCCHDFLESLRNETRGQ